MNEITVFPSDLPLSITVINPPPPPPVPPPDVVISQIPAIQRVSKFETGISHVNGSQLRYGDVNAVARGQGSIASAMKYHRQSLMMWGAMDPWPWDGKGAKPPAPTPTSSSWNSLDQCMAMIKSMWGTPVLAMWEIPGWMRGTWDGKTTTLLTTDQNYSDAGRPLTDRMADLLLLTELVAARYMAAPYNVRHFQTGVEMHGFYRDRKGGFVDLGYDAYPGTPGQADMGMAYLHNQMCARIVKVAAGMGIPRSDLTFITNYPVIAIVGKATSECFPVGHPLRDQVWGSVIRRGINCVLGMLPLLDPDLWDVWSYDMGTTNQDAVYTTDEFTNVQRFSDVQRYLTQEVSKLGFGTKKNWVSEIYAKPFTDPGPDSQMYRAAILADALRRLLLEGASTALLWGPAGEANKPGIETDAALITSVAQAGGGQAQASYDVIKAFHDYFPLGTPIYDLSVSGSGLNVLGSDKALLLINGTDSSKIADGYAGRVVIPPKSFRVVTASS